MALAQEDRDGIIEAIKQGFAASSRPATGQTQTQTSSNTNRQFGEDTLKGVSKLGKAAASAGNDLNVLAEGAGSVVEMLPGIGKFMSQGAQMVVGYLEDTRGTFQNLAKVGASLEGELGEFRKGAAETRMPLDTFANMVGQNAAGLSALGGGVNEGVRAFRRLSSAMFEGPLAPINSFMALGMSIEESNEFILDNISMMRRQARMTGMTEEQSIAAAMNLAIQLDTVAKLTGRQAKEMQDEIKQRQRSGATQAALRLAEMRGATGAQEAYNSAQAELMKGPPALRNLVDDLVQTGVPMSKATQQFAALNGEAFELAKQAAAAAKRGDQTAAAELSRKATEAANRSAVSERNLQVSTLAQVSDIAQNQAETLEAVTDVVDAIAAHAKAMGISMESAEGSMEAFASLTKTLEQETNSQIILAKDSQTALAELNGLQIEAANLFSEGNKELAGIVFDDANGITKVAEVLRDSLSSLNEGIQNARNNLDPDKRVDSTPGSDPFGGQNPPGGYSGRSISPGQPYMVGERGPEIIVPATAGSVMNNAQSANAIQATQTASSNGMNAVVDQLAALNDKTDALLRINTKQVQLNDKQVKVIRGAGNLMRGVS